MRDDYGDEFELEEVQIGGVLLEDDTQSRVEPLSQSAVKKYEDIYRDELRPPAERKLKKHLPPPHVFRDELDTDRLSDGFHRFAAAKAAGMTRILVRVYRGGAKEARIHGARENWLRERGVLFSNKSKHHHLAFLLGQAEYRDLSPAQIAPLCGATTRFVQKHRAGIDPTLPTRTRGKDGKVRATANKTPKPDHPVIRIAPQPAPDPPTEAEAVATTAPSTPTTNTSGVVAQVRELREQIEEIKRLQRHFMLLDTADAKMAELVALEAQLAQDEEAATALTEVETEPNTKTSMQRVLDVLTHEPMSVTQILAAIDRRAEAMPDAKLSTNKPHTYCQAILDHAVTCGEVVRVGKSKYRLPNVSKEGAS